MFLTVVNKMRKFTHYITQTRNHELNNVSHLRVNNRNNVTYIDTKKLYPNKGIIEDTDLPMRSITSRNRVPVSLCEQRRWKYDITL